VNGDREVEEQPAASTDAPEASTEEPEIGTAEAGDFPGKIWFSSRCQVPIDYQSIRIGALIYLTLPARLSKISSSVRGTRGASGAFSLPEAKYP